MARAGPGRAGGSRRDRGRGQRRAPTWEISDSDTEGPAGAKADSEAVARAWDPTEERRATAEALRLLRPEHAVRRLVVRVDPGAPRSQGKGPGNSCASAGLRKHPSITGRWSLAHCRVRGPSVKATPWPGIGAWLPIWGDCLTDSGIWPRSVRLEPVVNQCVCYTPRGLCAVSASSPGGKGVTVVSPAHPSHPGRCRC